MCFSSEPPEKEDHITMSELVKKLAVQPELRVEEDVKLSTDAIYEFIKSVPAFEEGLLISCRPIITALFHVSNFRKNSGFMKTDAMAIAKHASLKTVDKNQTVFLQGSETFKYFF